MQFFLSLSSHCVKTWSYIRLWNDNHKNETFQIKCGFSMVKPVGGNIVVIISVVMMRTDDRRPKIGKWNHFLTWTVSQCRWWDLVGGEKLARLALALIFLSLGYICGATRMDNTDLSSPHITSYLPCPALWQSDKLAEKVLDFKFWFEDQAEDPLTGFMVDNEGWFRHAELQTMGLQVCSNYYLDNSNDG